MEQNLLKILTFIASPILSLSPPTCIQIIRSWYLPSDRFLEFPHLYLCNSIPYSQQMSLTVVSTTEHTCTSKPRHNQHPRLKGVITYLRVAWVDYLVIVLVAGLGLGIYFTPVYNVNHRVIPIWPSVMNSNITDALQDLRVPTEYSYPWLKEPLPSWACALVVILVPFLVICIFQLKIRSLWDLHAGLLGVLKAIVAAYA